MLTERPKIAYFGSDAICLPGLRYLCQEGAAEAELALVVSQPDRRQGRGKQLRRNPVAEFAVDAGIPLAQPEKPGRELAERLRSEGVALAFVMAYGHFLTRPLREAPRHGMLNFHGSLLPAYRGASPVETALAMGETSTGVCLMEVAAQMDAGGVADCEPVPIGPGETGPGLRARIGEAVVPLLRRNLGAALAGQLAFQAQDEAAATFCRKITKEDARLDFTLPASALERRLRAFQPWPGAAFHHADAVIRVGAAEALEANTGGPPGTVLQADSALDVATGAGVIRFLELQRPGGKMLPADAFLRGYPIAEGTRLPHHPATPLVRGPGEGSSSDQAGESRPG